ncbi:hypothetical protein [Levilactobacillus brevis]|uniref:hypothetical protein n=1 Tax=Levilactobacillus brevis TaxID=1580 RepID=UPI0011240237|nr:hypothetical protein [Levilactobacillus brevis]
MRIFENLHPIVAVILIGIPLAGCSSVGKSGADSKVQTNAIVGDIKSVSIANPDVAYKVTNKQAKFYHSLKTYGKKSAVIADYDLTYDETLGVATKYVTTSGTYYHMFSYDSGGFEKSSSANESFNYDSFDDFGYVKASDVKRVSMVKSQWTYKKAKPYYVANPYTRRIWSAPIYTKHYTYITKVFDRLTTTQLYATKELIKRNGAHYVFLETAHQKLGWVYKTPKVLIAGKYRDAGRALLKPKSHDTMTVKRQNKKSTTNRVGVNDSLSLPQRAYVVRNKDKHISKVLVIAMDNRPIKVNFRHGQATKLTCYAYQRTIWKTITKKKTLKSSYYLAHSDMDIAATDIKFYKKSSKKLLTVKTNGNDGVAKVLIYRNGRVTFNTRVYKNVATYPLTDFD